MAEDTKFSTEDIANAQKIADILEDTKRTKQDLLNLTIQEKNETRQISDILKEEYGKQAEFLTQAEIEVDLRERRLEILDKELQAAKELESLTKNIAKEENLINALKEEAAELERKAAEEKDKNQKASEKATRQAELTREQAELLEISLAREKARRAEISNLVNLTSEELEKLIASEKDLGKTTENVSKLQENIRNIVGNQIEETFGVKDATDSVSDALIDVIANSEDFGGKIEGIKGIFEAVGMEAEKRLNLRDMTKGLKGFASDFATDFTARFTQVAETIKDIPGSFAQQTGFSREFGEQLQDTTIALSQQGFALAEVNEAATTLFTTFNNFTELDQEVRDGLIEDAAVLSRLGVANTTFATAIENLTTGMGMNEDAASNLTKEITSFAQAAGIAANDALEDLNSNFDILATHGRKKGIEVFKQLAVTAKRAGIEMSELVKIGKQFDTFEGSMKSAGKLNFILGGPLINSMEMLNATEEKRIAILRKSLDQSGKSFDQLGRRGKEALASTLGVSVAVAERLFNDKNLQSIEDATAAVEGNKKSLEELAKEGKENLTLEQRRTIAAEQQATQNENLAKAMGDLQSFIVTLQETFSGFLGTIGAVAMVMQTLSPIFTLITGLMTKKALATQAAAIADAELVVAEGAVTTAEGVKTAALTAGATAAGANATATTAAATAAAASAPATGAAATGFFAMAAGAFAAAAPILAVVAAVALIGAAIYAVIEFFPEIMDAFSETFDFIAELATTVGDILKSAFKYILKGLAYLAEGFAMAISMPFTVIVEGIALLADLIPGFDGDAVRAFSPLRIIRSYGAEVQSSIDAFQEGTDNAPGGMALVGEAGPELMNVPGGSQVIPAEQTQAMMTTLETFNNIVTGGNPAATQTVNNVVGATVGGNQSQTLNLNLVVKMDEREIARVARKVSMDTVQRGLEVSV